MMQTPSDAGTGFEGLVSWSGNVFWSVENGSDV